MNEGVILMRDVLVALGLGAVMLFASYAAAADHTKERARMRTTYQTGTRDQNRTQDQQKIQKGNQTQSRGRVWDGSGKTKK
jgi:hypothetical protein